ncbi:hypothetical protein ACJIZ3_011462 [Penstemon smallii]|uniref:RING-type E3 ubiquitin transferase n=1 Tax=Penstemon smallii TaxID=265156 RepID=A0ABD3UMS2_9LAMI
MALTILVLLTALFFMGFFSVYIRRFSATTNHLPSPPRHHRPQPSTYKRNNGGLDPSAVNSLPIVSYCEAAKHRIIIDDCPICLTEFQDKECVKLIPYCGHVFHPKCVDTWLSSHVTCPLCRSAQLFVIRGEEVCLDVAGDTNGICLNEVGERSTVDDGDTWRRGEGSCGGVRRTCSCSNLPHHAVLQRSTSF